MAEQFRPQERIHNWKTGMMPLVEQTPHAEYKRSLEEVAELGMEVELFDGSKLSRNKIASEAADVVIRMMGIADSVGVDLEEVMREKIIYTTTMKYPVAGIKRQMERGLSWSEAMHDRKAAHDIRWQKRLYGGKNPINPQ